MFPQVRSLRSRRVPGERRLARGGRAPCSRRRGCSHSSALRDHRRNRATSAEIQVGINLTSFPTLSFTFALNVWSFWLRYSSLL